LHPSGVAKSSTSLGWGKGWNVTSAGWQVTLCDPIWHVSSSSGEACCELLYPVTLLLYYFKQLSRLVPRVRDRRTGMRLTEKYEANSRDKPDKSTHIERNDQSVIRVSYVAEAETRFHPCAQLKPNSITLAGSKLVRSWFGLKFGLSSSLLAAN